MIDLLNGNRGRIKMDEARGEAQEGEVVNCVVLAILCLVHTRYGSL